MKKTLFAFLFLFVSQLGFGQQKSDVQPVVPYLFKQFPNVRDFTISSLEDEAYFTAQSYQGELSVILSIEKENNEWSEPEIASFSGKYQDLEPFLSPDGLMLFFASNRPVNDSMDIPKDFDIWYVQRKSRSSEWSDPINLGYPVNSKNNEFYPSISNNFNLYFTCDKPGSKGKDDIYLSKYVNGHYSDPIALSDSINSEGYEFNAYVSLDETYIIFSGYNRADGMGSGDLYISYKNADGIWSLAENLGPEINSEKMDYCPYVDTNTNTLYFTSKRSQINSNRVEFRTINDLLVEMNKYENGLSRIYKLSIEQILSTTKEKRR